MRSVGQLEVSGALLVSGSDSQILGNLDITGVVSASSFSGDGSGLVGVTSYTDTDTQTYLNSIGVISGSTQIASDISGAFTEPSSSFNLRLNTLENFSSALDSTYATELELNTVTSSLLTDYGLFSSSIQVNYFEVSNLPIGILSSSTQIASDISGAFLSTSASIAADIANISTDFADITNKPNLVSGSAQISYTGITDIPANIISSSAQLSDQTIPGNLTVEGKITAQEFHTEFVSASIIYESGSTQFGDTVDDTHTFIGTLSATTIQNVFSSSAQVDYNSIQNQPTIPTNNNQLTNGAGYCTTDTTYTANDMLTCIKTVDGAGSGLDADLLDGNQASAFYLATNPSGYTTCTGTVTGTGTSGYISKWNGSTSQTNSVIYDNGTNVGIGTSSPANQLTVYRTSSNTSNGALRLDGNGNYAGVQFATSGTLHGSLAIDNTAMYMTHTFNITFKTGGSTNVGGTERMRINSSGNVGIGTTSPSTKLEVNGTATVTTIVETSALRFKENINTIEDTSIVDKLRPVSFDWKDSKETEYGFIAEEVYDLDTTLVTKSGEDELQGVKYTKLIPLLVKKVQEQDKQIKELEYKLNTISTCIK